MTSKNLSFKLMAEDLKRRVWTIALTVLALIFAQIFPIAVKCSEYAEQAGKWNESTREYMETNILSLLKVNPMAAAVLIGAAVLWAVTSFCYLHNSKKVDFYHSIPVKRHVLYIVNYFNGIWVTAAVYLVFTAVTILLAGRCGISGGIHTGRIWMGALINVVFYSLLYTTVSAAMMLTGNIVVALLGTAVFFSYGPAVVGLSMAYMGTWFKTYRETAAISELFEKLLERTSPFTAYVYALGNFGEGRNVTGAVVTAFLVTVVLAVGTCCLYWLRPSEAAGKAMAFPKTENVIRVLIVIPVGVVFGMFFFALRATVIWLLVGAVVGTVLAHCIIEIIYRMDFRRLFDRKIYLAGCLLVTLGLSMAGFKDWFGYDTWMPDTGKIQSMAINMEDDDTWVTYGQVEIPEDESKQPHWDYGDENVYLLEHMELTDCYPVMELVKNGIQVQKELRKANGRIGSIWDVERQDDTWKTITVQYHLNSGKKVNRTYTIRMNAEAEECWTQIYDSVEFKMGKYPVLSQSSQDTEEIYFQQYNQVQKVETDHQMQEHLLAVYQSELKALTIETRKKEYPMATIQFRTKNQCEGISRIESLRGLSDSWYSAEYISNRCYYPVYPSFTGTIALLKEAGVDFTELNTENVLGIQITSYPEGNGNRSRTVLYRDAKDLEALIPALNYQDYVWMNDMYYEQTITEASASVLFVGHDTEDQQTVVSEAEDTENWYPFCIDPSKLSKEQRMKYLQE